MITEFYPNPNKPKSPYSNVPGYVPPQYDRLQANGFGPSYNEYWAKKKGCTVEEFIERDMAFKKHAARCTYVANEVVYPYSWAEYQKKGKCRILKIDRGYGMSDLEWKDNEPLFLVEATSEKNNFSIFRATPGFFQKVPPTEPKTEEPKKDGE